MPHEPAQGIPPSGLVKVVFILAEAEGQSDPGGSPCTPDPWPLSSGPGTPVPSWAPLLLQEVGETPVPGSITDFFLQMSNGQHDVRGVVYPEVVYLEDGMATWNEDLRGAHNAVIDSVDNDPAFSFDDFDADGDDIVDQVIICWRQVFGDTHALALSGIPGASTLDLALDPKPVDNVEIRANNGIYLAPRLSQRSAARVRGLVLHEYGHDVLDALNGLGSLPVGWAGGHIKSIGRYGVMDGTDENYYAGTIMETIMRWKLGWIEPKYEISFSGPGSQVLTLEDVGANGDQAGFGVIYTEDPKQYFVIECRDSTATLFTDGSSLGGACGGAVKGNSGLVIAHVSEHERYRAHGACPSCGPEPDVSHSIEGWWIGAFGQQAPPLCADVGCENCTQPPCPNPPCTIQDVACCPDGNFPPTIDIEVPQGMVDTLTWVPDPVLGFDEMSCMTCEDEIYPGDLEEIWGNGVSNVFAPWTNPSTDVYWFVPNDPSETAYRDHNMCSMRREQSMYSGLTFYDIHWETEPGGGNGVMQVTVRYDDAPAANQPFVLPSDMEWDGKIRLTQDVAVPAGGTLTVNAGATVIASTEDLLAAGVDQQRVEIVVPASANLVVAGTAGNEVTFTSSRDDAANTHYLGGGEVAAATAGDWYGIRMGDLDAASLANAEFRYARGALALEDAGLTTAQLNTLLANAAGLTFTGNVSDVSFDRDVLVDTGNSLTVPPGWTLGFGPAAAGSANYGASPKSECVVRGQLVADGTIPEPITFRSDSPTPTSTDWGGFHMELIGAEWTGYGYVGSVEPLSSISNATIRDAENGITVAHLIAPNLDDVDFVNIAGAPPKHIYLDNSDAFLPWGVWSGGSVEEEHGEWDLLGGTYVVATNAVSPSLETSFGVAGKVDLVPQGRIFTTGSETDGDSVYFRPETLTSSGDAWGGLLLDADAAGSVIEYADIGYAEYPIFFFEPDNFTTLRNSRIHDFGEVGAWVDWAVNQGVVIESNTIERGGSVLFNVGRSGILLDGAVHATIRNNKVDLFGLVIPGETSAAVDIIWPTTNPNVCGVTFLTPHHLLIDGNWIVGPGTGAGLGSHTGVASTWVCADAAYNRTATYVRNYVEDFNLAGLLMVQTQNIQADSNNVVQSLRSVDISRDSNPLLTGPTANFRANWLEVTSGAGLEAVRSNNRALTKLGMESPVVDRGNNGLMVERVNVEFVLTYVEAGSPILESQNCYWYTYTASPLDEHLIDGSQFDIFQLLRPKLKPTYTLFDFVPRYTSDVVKSYHRMSGAPQVGRTVPGLPSQPLDDRSGDTGRATTAVDRTPAVTSLASLAANPTRGSVQLGFGIAAGDEGVYAVDVFDVRGRHVAGLLHGPLSAGTGELTWNLRDASGGRVSSGVYFVRMTGPGFAQTHKIAVLE
ncbi:MAG: hypothetical protein ACT4PE_00825 [Candidatus Eiseniibacteriota bacterium]